MILAIFWYLMIMFSTYVWVAKGIQQETKVSYFIVVAIFGVIMLLKSIL